MSVHAGRRFRRELTAAERHLDIVADTAALDAAKDALEQEIRRETLREARRVLRGGRPRVRLTVTPRMVAILDKLHDAGVKAATREAKSLGIDLGRSFAAPGSGHERAIANLVGLLSNLGSRMSTRAMTIAGRGVAGEVSDVRQTMHDAIADMAGGRDAASQVVSMTFASGLDDVFSANEDAFGGWQYSAVMDGGTCESCSQLDGEVYPTWEAISEVLPNGGPNPECDGGDRCRCRPVGLPPDDGERPAQPPPEPEPAAPFALQSEGIVPRITRDVDGAVTIPDAFKADHDRIMETGKAVRAKIDDRVNALYDERVAASPDAQVTVSNREIAKIEREEIAAASNGAVTFGSESLEFTALGANEGTVRTMAEKLPDSWVKRSNESINPLRVRQRADADGAYFDPGRSEIVLTPESNADVVLHELVHRMEQTIPELRDAEATFYEWRARGSTWAGEREAATEFYPGQWGVGDKFADRYSGRDYLRNATGERITPRHEAYELLTTGMQWMHGTTRSDLALQIRGDREYRDWVLGVLSSLRP